MLHFLDYISVHILYLFHEKSTTYFIFFNDRIFSLLKNQKLKNNVNFFIIVTCKKYLSLNYT